ncbi:MAG: LuxR family transcriptional regulator [Cyanobacteria bacterium 13_1_20CM_4_61_6]|nr:MAG: LuxR family transcriptional regulator [Cyanobacteria bacterium 13_1_20CM_4_61_6]
MAATDSETNNPLVSLSRRMADAVERVSSSIVAVDARPRVRTSGVLWREGIIVSTSHTVRRDEEITVTLHDGREVRATLAGRDAGTDLAVLRVEDNGGDDAKATANTPAQFTDASELKVGTLVLAVGRAVPERGVAASFGIVGHLGDKWHTWRGGEIDRLVRPDVSIFIGFSGGALVDVEGHIVGVNTTGLARGTGLTIPAATVDRVVDQLLAHGRIARPYLGIGMQPVALPEKLRERFNLRQATGLMMFSVDTDAPADKAGIIIGDILLALDEVYVADTDDVQAALGGKEVGGVVKARVLRGGEVKEVEITLGARPARKR